MKELILLHGALGSKSQFEELALALESKFNVHLMNFSGHGGEPVPEAFDIATFAEEVIAFMLKKDIAKADIFGYSMGGYVGLYAARKHPEMVGSVFTFATKFAWTPEIAQREIKMLNAEKIAQKIPAFAKELENRHRPADWKIVMEKTAAMMLSLGNLNVLPAGELSQIGQPVRIGIGDKDAMVTLEETIEAYRNLPDATLVVLPGTQHPFEKINSERLAAEIISFFN
ncbi:MAG TPA: alpha/beta hydrolase [Flavobacterium sp.]|jgi:pimeloyl-ACP methyl ester carboxylesterase